jgi:DNA-binding CsgD family transcriptional regulator
MPLTWLVDRPADWVGRDRELAVLAAGVEAVRRGDGALVWVEGEPGIGKSSLVAEALAETNGLGWDMGWGVADKLTQRLPLRVMMDCLGVRAGSPDPRRARAAELVRSRRLGVFVDDDAAAVGIEVLVALAHDLCAAGLRVIVIDDVQWADEASLAVWHELAASIGQLPLLLIAICRLSSRRLEVDQLRSAVARRGGQVITLAPLAETEVAAVVTGMLGSPPGEVLRQLMVQAAGNPLYVRELVDALVREGALQVGGAEIGVRVEQVPASLAVVLRDRLQSVPAGTEQMLRTAALLGGKFTVRDLVVLLRRPASELAGGLREAMTAGILIASGQELAFRHPLIQQALYETTPATLRMALHAEAAQQLAAAGADWLTVAQQLSAAGPGEGWAKHWLIQVAPALTARAPQLVADLLGREVTATPAGDPAWEGLVASQVRALLAVGSYPEAARRASQVLPAMTDPARRAETSWVLARAQVSAGHRNDAITTMQRALAFAGLPRVWRARMLALLAMLERASTGDLDAADAAARRALVVSEEAGDAFATAQALTGLWLSHGIRRDHAAALGYIDRALDVLGEDPARADLRSFALDGRIFTLQNLDRWPEAEQTLRQAREFAQRSGSPDRGTWATAAVLRYWLGQWDDALAELGSDDDQNVPGLTYSFLREGWSALLIHGVAALIAGRRDQRTTAGQQLREGLALPIETVPDRENRDFLVAAHSLTLEQSGEPQQAMRVLATLLPRGQGEMTLIHQWLPGLVRLAVAAGDTQVAWTAVQACQAEAEAETQPARAAVASLRCTGLLKSDPAPLSEAVAHYRTAGPAVELPAALEDLAAVLAKRGWEADARAALNEAVGLYENLNATWDIRRAEARLRRYGIRRGVHGRREQRAAFGWEALTPTEIKVAGLVATGQSTSDIARGMYLSRRTVQTHISHILTKLGAKGRVEIAREALRHDISA